MSVSKVDSFAWRWRALLANCEDASCETPRVSACDEQQYKRNSELTRLRAESLSLSHLAGSSHTLQLLLPIYYVPLISRIGL